MKNKRFFLIITSVLLLSCNKDDTPPPVAKSSAKQMTSFVFKAVDNSVLGTDLSATLNENAKTIDATAPSGTDITALVPTIEISPKATVTPMGSKDFTDPVKYTVTAEDGSTADYQAIVTVQQMTANEPPESFALLQVANDSVNVVRTPTFSWEPAIDPDGDTVTYDVYLDTISGPDVKVAEGLTETVFVLPETMALSLARDYFWSVTAKDSNGAETTSTVFSFKVKGLPDAQQLNQTVPFRDRANFASVVFDDKLWVLGGLDQGFDLDDAWSSADGSEWEHVNQLSTNNFSPVFFHDAIVFEERMWVLGGLANGEFSNGVFFSNDGFQWLHHPEKTQNFTKRSEHTTAAQNGKMWIIGGGGVDNEGNSTLPMDVWNTEHDRSWDQVTSETPFGGRKFSQMVSFQGKLWLIAGIDENANDTNDVWSSVDGITWEEETPSAQFSPRAFHTALVFDNKIWVIGGASNFEPLNDIWYSKNGKDWVDATPENSFPAQGNIQALYHQNKIWLLRGPTQEVFTIDYDTID